MDGSGLASMRIGQAASRPWPAISWLISATLRSPRAEGAESRPAGNDHDAVGDGEDLVQVLGDEQDGSAPVSCGDEAALHIGHRADVEAACRLVGEDQDRIGVERAPRISFCMLPPDRSRMRASGEGHFTS